MLNIIKGDAVVYNYDDISTDQIFPGKYCNLTDKDEIVEHILEGADTSLRDRLKASDIFVVGENFGCGSSREHAVIGIKEAGIKLVIASSAGRIWYRNAINLALPVIFCPGASEEIDEKDVLEVDLDTGVINNLTKNKKLQGEPLSEFIIEMLESGGIQETMKKRNLEAQEK